MKRICESYKLQAAYVILLSATAPLTWLWLVYADKMMELLRGRRATIAVILLILTPAILYSCILLAVGIGNIMVSFRMYKEQNIGDCINGMLIHKYGMVIFFVVNFFAILFFYFFVVADSPGETKAAVVLLSPILLPFLVIVVLWVIFCTWLAILPGSFYSFQVIRASYREHKIGLWGALWHGFLQLSFLTDVFDTMYLAVRKWGRGKKSAMIVGCVYLVSIIGGIWMVMMLKA